MAKDPVCGMLVEETPHALKSTRNGTTYYFCSETCLTQFEAPEKAVHQLKLLVSLGAALTVPILLLSYLPLVTDRQLNNYLLFLLSLPVQFYVGGRFYRGTYDALRARSANMDVLIALGTSAAWIYSTIVAFFPSFFGGLSDATYF